MTAVPTRRERQRQATFDEIVDVARQLLRDGEDVSVRAVAQEMGLTPPALYRYVDSHAELMVRVARSIFEDVVAAMTTARDHQEPDDPAAQIVASAAAFRTWALTNRNEFQLVFASATSIALDEAAAQEPLVITSLDACLPEESGVKLFGAFFSEIFGRLWVKYQFHIPSDAELDPDLLDVLRSEIKPPEVTDALGGPTQDGSAEGGATPGGPTPGMIWMFERSWSRLYGTVTLEVFGHVHPAFISTGALFGATMLDIGRELGIDGEWPRLQEVARATY
jgi:AcrR family transcriptional regulator